MSNRYDLIGYCSYRDNETGKIGDNFVEVLNEQDQQISDLETKLAKGVEIINEWMQLNIEKSAEINQLKQQLAEKEKEISQLYPFVKEHNNGNFIEYNVVYEKNGIVATTTFGRNKEMAYDYLKSLKKGN